MLGQQRLPPVAGHARKLCVRLHTLKLGPRLVQLLVDLRRFNLGEQIALVHVRADIEVPSLQVAISARVDGCIGKRLHVAGKREIVGLRSFHRCTTLTDRMAAS